MSCEEARRWDARVAAEVRDHGTVLPPWLRYPQLERYSIGWRMGYGEDHMILLGHWTASWTRDDWLAYLRRHAPVPVDWHDWACWQLGLGDDDDEEFDREEALAALGL